jgi:type II secretory pathway pseudopilin PulG
MKTLTHPSSRSLGAWTLAELMVAMAISSLLCAALITGTISLQKSFIASRHHILAQSEQMRLIDYMNLDLRRALSVTTGTDRLTVTIPDYYDSFGEPRDPEIKGGMAVYGPSPKTITYFKQGETIYRQEGATLTPLATDVSDFQLTFKDLKQSIQVSITFIPKYQFSTKTQGSARDGTATYTTTLLRNKRQG